MDPLGPSLLLRSFKRHLYTKNRSARTLTTYSSPCGRPTPSCAAAAPAWRPATRADLEAFMADLLARRMTSTAATYHKVLKILYGWLADEDEIPVNPMAK